MSMLPPRTVYSSLFFALAMVLLAVLRPSGVFDPATGRPRPFGFAEQGGTVFPLGVIVVAAAVVSLYAFAWIDLAWGRPSVSA